MYWYEKAGPVDGWAMLGFMYERGEGVPQDFERAAVYYRRAVETGEPIAMYDLGRLHARRQIAAADPVEGYMWLLLAETAGKSHGACVISYECKEWAIKDRPGYRRELKGRLSEDQRAEAQRRANAWLTARPSITK